MKAILLAAGRGSRMNDRTAYLPKCMITLSGKTLLSYCLDSLKQAGFRREDIGIVTGYCKEKIQADVGRIFYNERWADTNMFVSLTMARDWLREEICIVSYTDIVYDCKLIRLLMRDGADLAIPYYTDFWRLWSLRLEDPLSDLETFRIDGEKLLEIGGRSRKKSEIQGQYMGLLHITPIGWSWVEDAIQKPMPKNIDSLDITTLLAHMLSQGYPIKALRYEELWLECDSPADIQIYENAYGDALRSLQTRQKDEINIQQ